MKYIKLPVQYYTFIFRVFGITGKIAVSYGSYPAFPTVVTSIPFSPGPTGRKRSPSRGSY